MVDTETTTEPGRPKRDAISSATSCRPTWTPAARRRVVTRFPPEPNGFLHLGHAKSICLNFGIAREFGGRCHLRFDDTNPVKEEQLFIDSIQRDVRWLGFDWGEHLYYASDYFEQLYEWAEHLIRTGKAYVDDTPPEAMRAQRGTLTEPGQNSPFRNRSVEENLDLFRRMRAGEFPNGARVLRAKIDMASGNMNLRDPVLYRILHAHHPRTGDAWCIYPTYDFAHGQSDAIEGITHSICTLEFEDHRPLYDWLIENLPVPSRPHQYEFARLNIAYTVLSKRVLTRLVREGHVTGWDDPRMPTLAGAAAARRAGGGAARVRAAASAWREPYSVVDLAQCRSGGPRRAEQDGAAAHGGAAAAEAGDRELAGGPDGNAGRGEQPRTIRDAGTRPVTFGREIYRRTRRLHGEPAEEILPPVAGQEVRLRYAYFVTCREVVKDAAGEVTELRCTYDPATRGGDAPDGRQVQATLHWVAAADARAGRGAAVQHAVRPARSRARMAT